MSKLKTPNSTNEYNNSTTSTTSQSKVNIRGSSVQPSTTRSSITASATSTNNNKAQIISQIGVKTSASNANLLLSPDQVGKNVNNHMDSAPMPTRDLATSRQKFSSYNSLSFDYSSKMTSSANGNNNASASPSISIAGKPNHHPSSATFSWTHNRGI